MQFFRTENLKPGMRLAKPIYNKMGILLYDRDSKLTSQVINSIENFGLIGIYVLEPAEPLPPLSKEDIQFEQNQTIYMFKLRDCLEKIQQGQVTQAFHELVDNLLRKYGSLDHQINFTQNLRSADDFIYKHSINTAILTAMIANKMNFIPDLQNAMVTASLIYSIGYLHVPTAIMIKGNHLEDQDRNVIQLCLEKGYDELNKNFNRSQFADRSMALMEYFIFKNSAKRPITKVSPDIAAMAAVLQVADQYDQLTAMNIGHSPFSEIMAMQLLREMPEKYSKPVVDSLADCIHIVPAGASVDLSDGHKAIVLVENPSDFMKPLVLRIDNNTLYDLSKPEIYSQFQITDIMKTMDNRIEIHEDTLKLFVADARIKETVKRFRKRKIEKEQRRKAREEASFITTNTQITSGNTNTEPVTKPVAKSTAAIKDAGSPAIPKSTKTTRRKLI